VGNLISRFTLQNLFFGNGNQSDSRLLRCESRIAVKGTSAVYTGKHAWPSLSRPALGMAVTPRVGGYMRPCGRVSGNGLGETESHWEKLCRRRLWTRAGERGDMVGEICKSLLQAAQYLDECNVEFGVSGNKGTPTPKPSQVAT
jgi:hypothetical protein